MVSESIGVRSGLNMSDKELTMWAAKFKLYTILHPEYMQEHEYLKFQDMCSKCLYVPSGTKYMFSFLHCPAEVLVTDDFKRVFVSKNENTYYCVEWIKHV